jgi:sigma-B regulation protein RsbU (phosphoserine phosphatase)
MPAAMFMALSRSVIRSVIGQEDDLSKEIVKANNLIWRDSSEGTFLTMFYAQINAENGEIYYVNAGHNPPLVYRAGRQEFETLNRTGMAAGVEKDTPYSQGVIHMEKGDYLLMYTDGVTDAQVGAENFGDERLKSAALAHSAQHADKLIAGLEKEICDFSGSAEPVDDLTMLIAKKIA